MTERGELAFDVGPDPRTIGVVLRLAGPAPSEDRLAAILAARLPAAPRWASRVRRTPGERPRWDPVAVDVAAHVRTVRSGSATDDDVLAATVHVMREPWALGESPPWRVTRVVTGTGRDAVVLTLHHVLTDGTGVLATASALLGLAPPDPGTAPPAQPDPRVRPGRGAGPRVRPGRGAGPRVRPGRGAGRAPATHRVLGGARTLALGLAELAAGIGPRAPRTVLSAPIGTGFGLAVVDLDLDRVRAAAHRHGATVNDVLLVAGTGALAGLLARRGDPVTRLVCSVPASRARPGDPDRRARTGVLRVAVPTAPGLAAAERLRRTRARTCRRRRFVSGESAPLLAWGFATLGRWGAYGPVLARQRLINTVVSNLRGPAEPIALAGVPVEAVVPVASAAGNVPVYFTALSYAGRLRVTLRADERWAGELPALADDVRAVVAELVDDAPRPRLGS
ncbi:wax ester/triacylglycerol synthase domain-containing protein [Xylanimonas allomyrinae]|uniref:wax ester/triacylglycerol synthase domain-containing protein n=1 Tax=Xylanimonas allomyrinae TaxID=2509459 RepID=UPI0013A66ED4|nr:wax ester/triacylglycerol synthase domain-containing protein [Xylanimonas allomyrinae]